MVKSEELENRAKEMFTKLKKHINEEVTIEFISYGELKTYKGTLKRVKDFINVEIGTKGIPFVGYGHAIFIIYSKNREVLYINSGLGFDYDKTDLEEVQKEKRKIFGDRIVDEEIARKEKAVKEGEEYLRQSTLLAKKNKLILQKEGLALVKPETAKAWLDFTENKGDNGYYYWIIKGTVEMMKKIEEGVPYDEAINKVFEEELNLLGFQRGSVVKCLTIFSKQGEEFRKFWNEYCGFKDLDGIALPALSHLSK